MTEFIARPCYQAERDAIFRLRYQIYIEEMGRDQSFADPKQRTISEPLDQTGTLLACLREDKLVGTCRVNFSDSTEFGNSDFHALAAFDQIFPGRVGLATKMMVQPEYRGQTAFLALARAVIKECLKHDVQALVIDTNSHLLEAFGKMGFVAYRSMQHPQYGEVSLMVLFFEDHRHIKRIDSPFKDLVKPKGRSLMSNAFNLIHEAWLSKFETIENTLPFSKLTEGPITIEEYGALMRQIFHHARENPQIQVLASVRFRGEQRDCVKPFFKHATSEIGHDQLALNDLKTLGVDVTSVPTERPLPATTALLSYPFYQIEHLDPVGYLGYLFHLEFMPTHCGKRVIENLLSNGIPEAATTFIQDHATVDTAHNKLMEMYVKRMVTDRSQLETVIYALELTADLYTQMIDSAFQSAKEEFRPPLNPNEVLREERGLLN